MKTTLPCRLLFLASVIGLVGPLPAADNTWKLPNLNPFARGSKPPTAARVSDSDSWHFPKLLPSPFAGKRSSSQPGIWDKMTAGTKSAWSKTTSALNPWDEKQAAAASKSASTVTGSNSLFSQATRKQTATKETSSVQPASWWSAEKREEPKSVNEFLGQPRPQ